MKVTASLLLLGAIFLSAPRVEAQTTFSQDVDDIHTGLKDDIFSVSNRIDRFFGNGRTEEQRKDDFLRLGGEIRFREADPVRFRQRARLGLNLDAISDRLRLIVEDDSGERRKNGKALDDIQEGADRLADFRKDGTTTGLRYNLLRETKIKVDLDGGLRFSGGPNPYARLRFSRRLAFTEKWSIEPNQYFLWSFQDGFGEKTRLDIDRSLGAHAFTRARSEVLWAEESRGVDLFQEFSVFHELSSRAHVGALVSMVAYTNPGFVADEYRTAIKYRESFLFPWLYAEVEPALAFPDDRSHRMTPEILFRFDIYFDRTVSKNPFGGNK